MDWTHALTTLPSLLADDVPNIAEHSAHVVHTAQHAAPTLPQSPAELAVSLITLTVLEIVLGVDNIIFIAIIAGRLPENDRARGRYVGLSVGVVVRCILLFFASLFLKLTADLFVIPIINNGISGKDLILLGGGFFLIANAVKEIHGKLEGEEEEEDEHGNKGGITWGQLILQMAIINVVFSIDSVVTAVGMSGVLWIMVTAVLVSSVVMVVAAGAISDFIERHPSAKLLALSFLILIGSLLVVEGWDSERAHNMGLKNYAYFAMAYAFIIEMLNIYFRKKRAKPVKLHQARPKGEGTGKHAAASEEASKH